MNRATSPIHAGSLAFHEEASLVELLVVNMGSTPFEDRNHPLSGLGQITFDAEEVRVVLSDDQGLTVQVLDERSNFQDME